MSTQRASRVWWIGDVPNYWDIAPVRSRFAVQLGKMVDSARPPDGELRPYLRNINVQWDHIEVDQVDQMTFTARECKTYELLPDDLLVCEGGEVGRAALWHDQLPGCLYQKAIHADHKAEHCQHLPPRLDRPRQ